MKIYKRESEIIHKNAVIASEGFDPLKDIEVAEANVANQEDAILKNILETMDVEKGNDEYTRENSETD